MDRNFKKSIFFYCGNLVAEVLKNMFLELRTQISVPFKIMGSKIIQNVMDHIFMHRVNVIYFREKSDDNLNFTEFQYFFEFSIKE